jgi:hypothetical protein
MSSGQTEPKAFSAALSLDIQKNIDPVHGVLI